MLVFLKIFLDIENKNHDDAHYTKFKLKMNIISITYDEVFFKYGALLC